MSKDTESPLGPALRTIRRRLGITLAEVAKRTNITASTLSRVENSEASLTYDKLIRLAEGLSVDIAELFRPSSQASSQAGVTARRSVDRSDGAVIKTPKYLYRYLHTDISGKKLVPTIIERLLHNVDDFGKYHRHPGEAFIFVLEGTMDLYTEFYSPMRVEAGQSAYIDSTMGHACIAVGDRPCRVLGIMTAAEGASGAESQLAAMLGDSEPTPAPIETVRPKRQRLGRGRQK